MLLRSALLSLLGGAGMAMTTTFSHGAPFVDPSGDTFGSGPVQHDIVSINATLTSAALTFTESFLAPISSASALAPNSVVGFIDIDTDQSAATGAAGLVSGFGNGPSGLGVEFYIDLFSEAFMPGLVDVVNAVTLVTVGTAPISYTSNGFSVTVPLALLSDDGLVNYATVVGTFGETTDQARDSGLTPAASVPIPATSALLGLGLAGIVTSRRKPRP